MEILASAAPETVEVSGNSIGVLNKVRRGRFTIENYSRLMTVMIFRVFRYAVLVDLLLAYVGELRAMFCPSVVRDG